MIRTVKTLLLPFILLGLLLLAACGGNDEDSSSFGPTGLPGRADSATESQAYPAAAAAPAAISAPAAPAPAPPRAAAEAKDESAGASASLLQISNSGTDEDIALVSQQRIIVRTVDMGLVVDDVPAALDDIAALAEEMGGWLVTSDRSQKHSGFISVRVPADQLDKAVLRLRESAVEVESEVSTSRDVTDEYVDLTARLKNLDATEQALISLMERAEKVEDALGVQRELTRVQEEIERHLGRVKFLEQTSAFSLINVFLRLAPVDMTVDAGDDLTASVGRVARFRASFKPPEDMEHYTFTWDFGDGSPPVFGDRTAPTLDEDTRLTATMTHVYGDDRDSPYIVEVKMTATGEAGVAEGEDILIATVTKTPTMEVFAGNDRIVDEGEEVEFSGSFTHPEGLKDLVFRWEFGDGSPAVTGPLGVDVTSAAATHKYADHRPFAYTATLTITAQSDAGEIETTGSLQVLVNESRGWTVSGWSPDDTGKAGVRALSAVGQGMGTFFIWLVIFSPVWIGIIVAAYLFRRRRIRRSSQSQGTSV